VQRGGVEFAGTTGSGTTQQDYERVLQRASSKLDFSVGEGLYLIPSDMTLHDLTGAYNGYNNKLLVATSGLGLGENPAVNAEKKVPTPTPPAQTGSTPAAVPVPVPGAPTKTRPAAPASDGHEELKAAIVVVAIIGFAGIAYYSRR
jgi:hypothetical protein